MIRFVSSFGRFAHYGSLHFLIVLSSDWLWAHLVPSGGLLLLRIVMLSMPKELLFAQKVIILFHSASWFARSIQGTASQAALFFPIGLIMPASFLIIFFLWQSNDFPLISSGILLESCWTIEYFRVISWVTQFAFRVYVCFCFALFLIVKFVDL